MKRRNNLGKKWGIGLVILLLIGLIFLTSRYPAVTNKGEGVIQTIVSPVNKILYKSYGKVQEIFSFLFGTRQMRVEYEKLKEENAKLKDEVMILENLKARQPALEAEYAFIKSTKNQLIRANITGKDPGNYFIRFTIDRGKNDGIQEGDVVVQGVRVSEEIVIQGVVGTITETGRNWAKVSSILDDVNNISFKIARTNAFGVINERTSNGLKAYLLNADANVLIGDYAMTSGVGKTYPANILIGEVTEVGKEETGFNKTIVIKPPIDFTALNKVYVIQKASYQEEDVNIEKLTPKQEEKNNQEENTEVNQNSEERIQEEKNEE